MKKHKQKTKQLQHTKIVVQHPSYALALVKTKTLQFFVGLAFFCILILGGGITAVRSMKYVLSPVKTTAPTPTAAAAKAPSSPQYYTVQEGESLSDIANKEYGNPDMYTKIIDLNNIADPNTVDSGTRLRVR